MIKNKLSIKAKTWFDIKAKNKNFKILFLDKNQNQLKSV